MLSFGANILAFFGSETVHLVLISPTFYEQLLCQNPFCQKITNPNCKHVKAAQKTFVQKAACKIFVKLTHK